MGSGRSRSAGRNSSKLLVVSVLACTLGSLPSAVDAHASLQTPTSRNVVYFANAGPGPGQGLGSWYANGGNGLGPRPFRPAGNPGVCGDPYQESPITNLANFQGPVTTYTSGATIRMSVRLQVNHGGRLTFRLCDRRTSLDQACFNGRTLLRADNGKPHWYILTGSWANTNAGNPEFANIDYRLPAGFSCPNGCVLQMEYFTYNTCLEQCPVEDCGFYAARRNDITGQAGPLAYCSQSQFPPELFRNCADIIITGSGCTTTCPSPNVCQTGGGCNSATRTCNPITNLPNGQACSGGTCQNGQCTSGCSTNCPTVTNAQCQTGGGCNTATRTCNPIANRPNGTPCTGGTCQTGVCQTSGTGTCTGSPGQTLANCVCSRNPLGYYQDTANGCRGGIWCYQGGAQYIQCATGTLYDANLRVCNWASAVTCPAARTASAAAAAQRTRTRRSEADVTRTPAQTAEEAAAAAVAASTVAAAQPAGVVDSTVVDATAVASEVVPAGVVAPATVDTDGVQAAEPTAAAAAAVGGDAATEVDTAAGVVPAASGAAAVVTEAGAVPAEEGGVAP